MGKFSRTKALGSLPIRSQHGAEITAAGKLAVFVPFPRAADDHQNVNARALERAGAAIVVKKANSKLPYLVDTITALLVDQARLDRMSQAARSLSHPQAVEDIADWFIDSSKIECASFDIGSRRVPSAAIGMHYDHQRQA